MLGRHKISFYLKTRGLTSRFRFQEITFTQPEACKRCDALTRRRIACRALGLAKAGRNSFLLRDFALQPARCRSCGRLALISAVLLSSRLGEIQRTGSAPRT